MYPAHNNYAKIFSRSKPENLPFSKLSGTIFPHCKPPRKLSPLARPFVSAISFPTPISFLPIAHLCYPCQFPVLKSSQTKDNNIPSNQSHRLSSRSKTSHPSSLLSLSLRFSSAATSPTKTGSSNVLISLLRSSSSIFFLI